MKHFVAKKRIILLIFLIVCNIFLSSFPQEVSAASKITIVIDPGHGGVDTGASKNGINEKDINLDISKRLQKLLSNKGYKVILTRENDSSPGTNYEVGNTRQRRDLNARVDKINKSGASLFLSIHVNSLVQYPSENGSIAYYWPTSQKSKALALKIQRTLNKIAFSSGKRMTHNPRGSDFYILKNTKIPGLLIETAYLSNPTERKHLLKSSFKQEITNAIAKGLEQYVKPK